MAIRAPDGANNELKLNTVTKAHIVQTRCGVEEDYKSSSAQTLSVLVWVLFDCLGGW